MVWFLDGTDRYKKSKLYKVDQLLDWAEMRRIIGRVERSGLGPRGYDVVNLTKAVLIQAWHGLSDEKMEEALTMRIDFAMFCGFVDGVPDASTLCRFRNLLIEKKMLEKLFTAINRQLSRHGLSIDPSEGAILDATLIQSAARPGCMTDVVEDRAEDAGPLGAVQQFNPSKSADPDATWIKKGARYLYGYKGFTVNGAKHGAILRVHTTPANVSEINQLKESLGEVQPRHLLADKGYASQENRDYLRTRGIQDGIMAKARRNKPLTAEQRALNTIISQTRYKVEQGFGTLKRIFAFERASYMTLTKVHGQMLLKAMVFNINKTINLLALQPPLELTG